MSKKVALVLSIPIKSDFDWGMYDDIVCLDFSNIEGKVKNASLISKRVPVPIDDIYQFFSEFEIEYSGNCSVFGHLDSLSSGALVNVYQCLKVCEQWLESGFSIDVYASLTEENQLPLFGYKSHEVNLGSSKLLGAIIANVLRDNYHNGIRFINVKGDFLCRRTFRLTFMRLIEFFGFLNVIFKLMIFKLYFIFFPRKESISVTSENKYFLCRTKNQLDYALKLINFEKNNTSLGAIYLFPQVRSFGVKGIINSIGNSKECNILLPSIIDVARFYLSEKNTVKYSRVISANKIRFDLKLLLQEVSCFETDELYKYCTVNSLQNKNVIKLFNFAIKGRFAHLDRDISTQLRCSVETIQTINIVPDLAYEFPVSNFFCDSKLSCLGLNNGFKSSGDLMFEGTIFELKDVNSSFYAIKSIVFFTQPYEFEVTETILSSLHEYCLRNEIDLWIKLHPRDSRSNYNLHILPMLNFIDGLSNSDAFEIADICITKTSAVAVECISSGIPTLTVTLSEYDKTLTFPVLDCFRNNSLNIDDIEQFELKLESYKELVRLTHAIRYSMFENKDIESLSRYLI
ncbi:hypothetical protein AB6E30_06620 [Vibrio sp. 10N.247.311.12]|uniref:hypothetical protein n=1 Tax=Vibrio sp. 10N.247.311.12 TaxID=3229991 RepID=UPI00354E5F76